MRILTHKGLVGSPVCPDVLTPMKLGEVRTLIRFSRRLKEGVRVALEVESPLKLVHLKVELVPVKCVSEEALCQSKLEF